MSFSAPTSRAQRSRRILPWLLYLYALVLFAMHFVRIFDNSFWGDEGFTIRLVKASFYRMCRLTAGDVHPPLYYFFTQILYHIFGNHGYTYHLSALIPYGIILVLACTVVRKWFGMIPAAVLVTLSSFTSSAILYNVEARMYSLGALCVLAAYLAFYQIYKENRLFDWCVFGFTSLCAAYTHYYALLSVAFFYLMLLPLWFKGKEFRKRILYLYGGTVLGYIIWLILPLRHSFQRTAEDWWLTDYAGFWSCLKLMFGSSWLVIVFLAALVGGLLCLFGVLHAKDAPAATYRQGLPLSNECLLMLAGVVSIAGTIGIGMAMTYLIRPLLVPRYLFPLASVAYLMLGLCIQQLPARRVLAGLLVAVTLFFGVPNWWKVYQHEQALDEGTAQGLSVIEPAENSVIYTNDDSLNWTLLEYYYPDTAHGYAKTPEDCLSASTTDAYCIWMLDSFTEEELSYLKENGLSCEEIYSGLFMRDGFRGPFYMESFDQTYYIYHITQTEALQ